MNLAGLPPAISKAPPAYRLVPDTAKAYTSLSNPEPKGDQLLPSHFATLVAPMPPMVEKSPPRTRQRKNQGAEKASAACPRTEGRPTLPVPFGNVTGRVCACPCEPAGRVQITARHRQCNSVVVEP